MTKTTYYIAKMDCTSEESLIRIRLENIPEIVALNFNLDKRLLEVIQSEENREIEKLIRSLNLGCEIKSIKKVDDGTTYSTHSFQRKQLWWVLGINFTFFVFEMITGLISKSMGLVADSLDMFADAVVYGLSLWAVGTTLIKKRQVAKVSGYLQIILAATGFVEIIRRVLFLNETPDYKIMILVSVLALLANAASMVILNKTDSKDANIVASKIFTSNDIIVNAGVILAGLAVMLTSSLIPDLIVGAIVFVIVIRGAVRILKLG